jgi:MoaA/NifB/PqqE/SkfB family radical SAM enzyme
LVSARNKSEDKKIIDIYNPLETLQISLSNDCNLTCAYCSSEWSTAWHDDIKKNGKYSIDGYKNKNDNWAKLWSKIKQKNRSHDTKFFKLLCKEISLNPQIKNIKILGGEPLLNNHLYKILETIEDKKIKIISGLGVNIQRLKKIIDNFKDNKNISFSISAESTGNIFEFVRYGSQWDDFLAKVDYIKNNGIIIDFLAVISNITSFGIVSFYDMFSDQHRITYNSVTDRPFLQPNVLDDLSKNILIDSIQDKMDNKFFIHVKKSIIQPHKDIERKNLSIFLKEFSNRRKLKLDIFPVHFLKWLELN